MDYHFVIIYHQLIKALIFSSSLFLGRSGAGAAANDFFELDNDDDLGGLGECLEAPGSETINGGQDEVMQQIQQEMAAMRTSTASPPQPPPPGSNFIYFAHGSQFGYDEVWMCEDLFWFWSNRRKKSLIKVSF